MSNMSDAWEWFYPGLNQSFIATGSHRAVTFPTTGLITKCRMALAADLSQDWRSWNWLDISERVRWQDGVTVTTGKRDRDPNVPAGSATFTVENIDGELSRQNVFSTLYGLLFKHNPIWLTVDAGNGEFDEFFGFTQELPKRSDTSGTDGRIHLTCKGPMDHMFRTKEKESALKVSCVQSNPTVLWSFEEEATAGQGSSALSGGLPMQQTGTIDWAGSTRVIGAKPLPNMRSGSGRLIGTVPGLIPGAPGYFFDHSYIVSAVISPVDFSSGSWTVLRFNTENQNTYNRWELNVVNDGTLQLVSYNYAGSPTTQSTSAVIPNIFIETKLVQVTGQLLDVLTGDATFRIVVNGVEATTTTLTEYTGNILSVDVSNEDAASEEAALGFVMVHHFNPTFAVDTPNIDEIVDALDGHTGDSVRDRIARICRQRNIPFYSSAGDNSQRLGPQPIDTPLAIIRNAEIVDGTVYEREFGLAYISTAEYYRQPVSLALDIFQGHIAGELTPADDNTKFYNQWTVTRQDGSSSTQQKDGGISDNEQVISNEGTRNVETDLQTAYLASYYANRDSTETDRWPAVGFFLQKHPYLIPTYQAMPFGARVTVANMKPRWGVTALDLIVEGKQVFFNSKKYQVVLNTSDAAIYNIGQLDGGQVLDSRSSVLNADISTSGTALDVLAGNTVERLSTDSDDYPADILILGERITVNTVPSEICFDAFGRTSVNNWGTSDSGHVITSLGAFATDYSVNSGVGKQLLASVNVMRHNIYNPDLNDIELYADVRINVTPTGNSISTWVSTRFLDQNNYYDSVLLFGTDLKAFLAIGVRSGGTHLLMGGLPGTGQLALGTYTVGNFWRIHMRSIGNSVSCKAWELATQQEPFDFQMSGVPDSDTGVHPIGGRFAVHSRLEPGNTNVNPTVEWDNVHVVNPQRCSVTRSVNGVERAHPKGRQVRAYDPFILGL